MIRRWINNFRFKMLQMRGLTELPVLPSSASSTRTLDEREMYPHLFPNYRPEPVPDITVGSIILWVLLKLAVLIPAMWFLMERYKWHQYWFAALGILWLLVVYPAFMQYQHFKAQTHVLEENALCAKCRHFDETGHFCKVLDEHVSINHTPCGGERWEAQSFGNDNDETFS